MAAVIGGAVDKGMSEGDLLHISEFSEITGITRSTLLYYDGAGIFSPVSRGGNNYRFYSPEQIITVNLVNVLRGMGVPLKDIGRLAEKRSPQEMLDLFSERQRILEGELEKIWSAHSVISTFRSLIELGLKAEEWQVTMEWLPSIRVSIGGENRFGDDGAYYDAFIKYCKEAREAGVNLAYPIGGMFAGFEEFISSPGSPERFFSINPDGASERPAGRYIVGYTRGSYGRTNDLADRIHRFSIERGLRFSGPVYQIYLLDEISQTDPERYLLQLAVSVEQQDAQQGD